MADAKTGPAKADGAMLTIGEAAKQVGQRPHILRYWEEQFALLKPLRRAGGRRYYRPADMELLRTIDRLLNQEGYTVRGAKAALRAGPDMTGEATPATGDIDSDGQGLPLLSAIEDLENKDEADRLRAGIAAVRNRLADALKADRA